jgi:hypothetical protein
MPDHNGPVVDYVPALPSFRQRSHGFSIPFLGLGMGIALQQLGVTWSVAIGISVALLRPFCVLAGSPTQEPSSRWVCDYRSSSLRMGLEDERPV